MFTLLVISFAILTAFLARYAFIVLTLPTVFLLSFVIGIDPDGNDVKRPRLLVPVTIVSNIYFSYILTAWASFCVYYTKVVIANTETEWAWLYYIIGFAVCLWPLLRPEYEDFAVFVVFPSYIVFALWPVSMVFLHWWWLKYLP